nr:hypothetical protein [Tanacetum cinerariifolium]
MRTIIQLLGMLKRVGIFFVSYLRFYYVATIPDVFLFAEMDLFVFIRHSDPTKVRIWERELEEREVKLLEMTGGRTIPLVPPVTTALEDSGDSIDKLFDKANQEHSVERADDVLEETIAKDALEVVAEKTKKKQKRKVVGDASVSTYPPKKLRDDYQSLLPNTSGKSLAALCGMVPKGFAILSGVTEPLIATSVAPVSDVGPLDSVSPVADAPVVTVAVTTIVVADIVSFLGVSRGGESEAAEAIRLRIQLTTVEAADAAKDRELKDLREKTFCLREREMLCLRSRLLNLQLSRDKLNSQVASLESERDSLISQKSSLEYAFELFSACAWRLRKMSRPKFWVKDQQEKDKIGTKLDKIKIKREA